MNKNNNPHKKILLGIISAGIVLVGIYFFENFTLTSAPAVPLSQETVDLKLSTLSNQHSLVASPAQSVEVTAKKNKITIGSAPQTGCKISLVFSSADFAFPLSKQEIYTATIQNKGTATCVNPSLTAYYASSTAFASSEPRPSASNYYWHLPDLKARDKTTITFTLSQTASPEESTISTEICATADNGSDACGSLNVAPLLNLGGSTPPVVVPPIIVSPPVVPSSQTYGSWVWTSPEEISETYLSTILNGAKNNSINTLYITIDHYLTIDALPEGASKEAQKAAFTAALASFITRANALGISVDAEAGWRDWAEDPTFAKARKIIAYAKVFNQTHAPQIHALQYDVEPYLLPRYETNKADVLGKFVSLIDMTKQELGNDTLAFSIVIPHFYDNRQAWTPSITYNGITQDTFSHLLSILDTRPNSSIILMSYRNYAQGQNGSIEISETEVTQASTGIHGTKVIVAQETGNVEPSYVTFYNLPKSTYLSEIQKIKNVFSNKSGFGGIAVHYIDPFLVLR